jgi:hypothetical protein
MNENKVVEPQPHACQNDIRTIIIGGCDSIQPRDVRHERPNHTRIVMNEREASLDELFGASHSARTKTKEPDDL